MNAVIGHGPVSAPSLRPRSGAVMATPIGSHSSAATMNSQRGTVIALRPAGQIGQMSAPSRSIMRRFSV